MTIRRRDFLRLTGAAALSGGLPRFAPAADNAHRARLGFGQPDVLQIAAGALDVAHRAPLRAVIGSLHRVARREFLVQPMQNDAAEFAPLRA